MSAREVASETLKLLALLASAVLAFVFVHALGF